MSIWTDCLRADVVWDDVPDCSATAPLPYSVKGSAGLTARNCATALRSQSGYGGSYSWPAWTRTNNHAGTSANSQQDPDKKPAAPLVGDSSMAPAGDVSAPRLGAIILERCKACFATQNARKSAELRWVCRNMVCGWCWSRVHWLASSLTGSTMLVRCTRTEIRFVPGPTEGPRG